MSIIDLRELAKDYSNIFPCKKNYEYSLIREDFIVKIYEAEKKEEIMFLKVFDKNKLKNEENYDFLMNQINKEKEISKLCNCNHTVKLNKEFETENNIIFEKEYCDCDLKEIIFNNGPFVNQMFDRNNLQIFKEIAIDLAKALKFLYEQGIIHRDIKPQNIYLKELKNDKFTTKLGNFGGAIYMKEINKTLPMGTILYAAPEILKNLDYDEKCDMWSLGLTLFEIYFGYSPYGFRPNLNRILNVVYSKEKFIFRKSNIPTLDILFKRLLQINPENRMSFPEYYNFVTNKNFLKDDFIADDEKYLKLYEEILLEEQVEYRVRVSRCGCGLYREDYVKKTIKKIFELAEEGSIPDITNFHNEDEKFNNIIYYNNNIENHKISIYNDSDLFQKETKGAFILCTNLNSLNIIKNEILRIIRYEKRIVFNIITNGKGYEKDIKIFLNQNKEFKKYINKICIFCINVEKYLKFKKENPELIYDVTGDIQNVINFIKQFSLKDIKPYPITKLVTLNDYLSKYKERHKNIAQFYGDLTEKSYYENKKKNLEDKNKNKKEAELKLKEKHEFKNFLKFNLEKDLENLENLLLNLYENKTFIGDLNIWLLKEKMKFYELFLYFSSRFMYSLNSYANKYNQYYKENKKILFMGDNLYYSSLLSFERAVGKIILLTRFILTTNEEHIAKTNAGRGNEKQVYNTEHKFSVIFYITNLYSNEQWISNCINNEFSHESDKKIVFLPFSFFRVIKVDLDVNNYKADIFLETIGKKEILEEKIRLGKEIEYNSKENIMEIS